MPESSSSTEPRFVIGRLGRPHGLDGFLGVYVDESDLAYFEPDNTVLIADLPYKVRAVRRGDKGYQVKFVGVDTRVAAEELRGNDVEVAERRSLDSDEFWPDDLRGLSVRVDGEDIGEVVGVVEGAAQDRLQVQIGGESYEIPFVSDFVPMVDVDAGFVALAPIEGLIEPLA